MYQSWTRSVPHMVCVFCFQQINARFRYCLLGASKRAQSGMRSMFGEELSLIAVYYQRVFIPAWKQHWTFVPILITPCYLRERFAYFSKLSSSVGKKLTLNYTHPSYWSRAVLEPRAKGVYSFDLDNSRIQNREVSLITLSWSSWKISLWHSWTPCCSKKKRGVFGGSVGYACSISTECPNHSQLFVRKWWG